MMLSNDLKKDTIVNSELISTSSYLSQVDRNWRWVYTRITTDSVECHLMDGTNIRMLIGIGFTEGTGIISHISFMDLVELQKAGLPTQDVEVPPMATEIPAPPPPPKPK